MQRIIVFLFCSLVLFSCQSPDHPAVSFYYWKTVYDLSADEQEALQQNQVSTVYVRYFDVALAGGQPTPVSPITFASAPRNITVVPVVYLKNAVLQGIAVDVNKLAGNIVSLVNEINADQSITSDELQVDCDWTLTTKDTYFALVDALKKHSGKTVSATIRLHQVKYFKKTGVPPADHGVLMYYNMGHIGPDSLNSIYDRNRALGYIKNLKGYPLALDVALPMFSWGMHIRSGKVIALLNKVDDHTFATDTNFVQKAAPFFEVKHNVIKMGQYFERGDRIKIESITTDHLAQMADDLSEALDRTPREIIFFDLDSFNLKHYRHDHDLYQKISSTF